jgi:hypothetical protein
MEHPLGLEKWRKPKAAASGEKDGTKSEKFD